MEFYGCKVCNQVVLKLIETESKMTCCEEEMSKLTCQVAPEEDEHRPIIRKIGNFVTITVNHPMLEVHRILSLFLETNRGFSIVNLEDQVEAIGHFILAKDEEIKNAYVYCNVHELWSTF
ncbi:MAG: desulfoferrodoxin family protein [Candidatus Izemoplasmatales bacterium]|nr:desulfoferrodoxin family protein [Candidatus Izemoplasmatales bacterium]